MSAPPLHDQHLSRCRASPYWVTTTCTRRNPGLAARHPNPPVTAPGRLPEWLKRLIRHRRRIAVHLVTELGLEHLGESEEWSEIVRTLTSASPRNGDPGGVCTPGAAFCAGAIAAIRRLPRRQLTSPTAGGAARRLACGGRPLSHRPGRSPRRRAILAAVFSPCAAAPGATIKVLTFDFDGCSPVVDAVLKAHRGLNHNMETVARLQQHVHLQSQYAVSPVSSLSTQERSACTKSAPRAVLQAIQRPPKNSSRPSPDSRSIEGDFTLGYIFQLLAKTPSRVRWLFRPDEPG